MKGCAVLKHAAFRRTARGTPLHVENPVMEIQSLCVIPGHRLQAIYRTVHDMKSRLFGSCYKN